VSIEEQALVEVTHWLRRVMQYSAAHPACAELGEKAHLALTRALMVASPLTVGILKDDIMLGESRASHPVLRMRLAPHLHERGVLLLRFASGVTPRELTEFVELLTLPASTVFDRGGLLRLTMDKAIARIQVEELAHDVTDEEREAQKRRRQMREFFREMLRNLLANRSLDGNIGEHLRTLLEHPDIAVTILEEDPTGLAEAGAGLALMVQQEELRTSEAFGEKLRDVFLALAPESRARLFLGLPSLVGDFRQALGWALDQFSEPELARLAFPALRARAEDVDVVLYALAAAAPRDQRRRGALRWISLGLFDLPNDEAATGELLSSLAEPGPEFESFREERDCLREHAIRAATARELVSRRSNSGRPRVSAAPRGMSIPPAPPAPRMSTMGMPRVNVNNISSSIPPAGAPSSLPPPSLRPGAAFDGRRSNSAVLRAAARNGQLARVCRSLPAAAIALANEGASDAVLGIVRGLSETAKENPNGPAAEALRQIGASETAAKILSDLEEVVVTLDGDELEDILGAVKILVAHSPGTALDRLDASENRKMRRLLLDALGQVGPNMLPLLRARIRSTRWFVVRNAVLLLARCGGTAADLAGVARHPNERVRLEVVRALRSVPQDEASMNIAAQLLTDSSHEARTAALLLIRGEALRGPAIATLDALTNDEAQPEELRRRLVQALGHSPDAAAAEVLFRLLHPKGLLERGATAAIREAAAIALRGSRAANAAALFQQGLQSSTGRVRKVCERAAGGGS
jgi:hypothetical protein